MSPNSTASVRPPARSSTSSSSSISSITSLFESSLHLLGSLPVASTSSSPLKPITHRSARHGDIDLFLPSTAGFRDSEMKLQSHLLWPAGVRMAEMLEGPEEEGRSGHIAVRGETVLELGAGAALPSLIAAKSGARKVVVTDYPAPGIIEAIRKNVERNLSVEERARVEVLGLDWADCDDILARLRTSHPDGFSRILAADTLWISSLHDAQIRVMTSQLARTRHARIHVVAGLHSGRHCVRAFFDRCRAAGLCIDEAREWDRLEGRWSDTGSGVRLVHASASAGGEHRSGDWELGRSGSGTDDPVGDDREVEEELDEGTEESRRRWLLCVDMRWADLREEQ